MEEAVDPGVVEDPGHLLQVLQDVGRVGHAQPQPASLGDHLGGGGDYQEKELEKWAGEQEEEKDGEEGVEEQEESPPLASTADRAG